MKRVKPFQFWSLFRSKRAQIIKNVVYKCSKCMCFLNWGTQRNGCGQESYTSTLTFIFRFDRRFSSPIFFFFVFFKYLFRCFFRPFWLWQDFFNEDVKDPQNIFRKVSAARWFHSKQRHIFLQISLAYLTESRTSIQIWMFKVMFHKTICNDDF